VSCSSTSCAVWALVAVVSTGTVRIQTAGRLQCSRAPEVLQHGQYTSCSVAHTAEAAITTGCKGTLLQAAETISGNSLVSALHHHCCHLWLLAPTPSCAPAAAAAHMAGRVSSRASCSSGAMPSWHANAGVKQYCHLPRVQHSIIWQAGIKAGHAILVFSAQHNVLCPPSTASPPLVV
jgi:hypothetical protein